MSVFTIANQTFTDKADEAHKEQPDGAIGPFIASDVHGLFTLGNYANVEPIDVIFPTANSSKHKMAPGVALIMGPSESGKSWLGDQLSLLNGFPRVTYEEPVAHALVGVKSLAAAMLQMPSLPQHGVIIDSLRTLFYTTTGNTGKGGMNMSLYAMLTQWDIWAKSHSKILFIIVNPIQVDENILELIAEAGSGSVETYISTPGKGRLTYKTRSDGRATRELALTTRKDRANPTSFSVSAPARPEIHDTVEGILSLFTVLQQSDTESY